MQEGKWTGFKEELKREMGRQSMQVLLNEKALHCLHCKGPGWLESGVSIVALGTLSSVSLRRPNGTTGQDRLLWGTVKRSGP